MPKKISDDFRGTADEIAEVAKRLADGSTYQPGKFKKELLEKAFSLLLRPLSTEGDNEPWSLQRIHDATGINKSTISEMRIALIVLEVLPYQEDKFSTQHIRDIWAALKAPENKDKTYPEIAEEKGWDLTSVLYYARVGRFAGQVPSRDENRTRASGDLANVRAALVPNPAALEPELKREDYDKITRMLIRATDEDGYFEDRSINHIAEVLKVSAAVVKEVRVGLVALQKLPERKPIDRALITRMWQVLEDDKTTTIEELASLHRWEYQSLFRAGISGRLVGEVTPRVLRKKQEMLPKIIDAMDKDNLTPSAAARRFDLEESLVREWLRDAGETQQIRIERRREKVLALAIGTGVDLSNKQLAESLNLSEKPIRDDLLIVAKRLEASDKPEDKAKLAILQPRLTRMAVSKRHQQRARKAKKPSADNG